mgnify:CR=1 FL=1
MTDKRSNDQAPEAVNREQHDEPGQTQTVAEQAMDRTTAVLGESEKPKANAYSVTESDAKDVVDRMEEMHDSGKIDNGAYAGEPNHDDNRSEYGNRPDADRTRKLSDE